MLFLVKHRTLVLESRSFSFKNIVSPSVIALSQSSVLFGNMTQNSANCVSPNPCFWLTHKRKMWCRDSYLRSKGGGPLMIIILLFLLNRVKPRKTNISVLPKSG